MNIPTSSDAGCQCEPHRRDNVDPHPPSQPPKRQGSRRSPTRLPMQPGTAHPDHQVSQLSKKVFSLKRSHIPPLGGKESIETVVSKHHTDVVKLKLKLLTRRGARQEAKAASECIQGTILRSSMGRTEPSKQQQHKQLSAKPVALFAFPSDLLIFFFGLFVTPSGTFLLFFCGNT